MSRKAVIVHSLAQAKAALAPGVPVLLLSAEGAAGSVGPGWWREVVAAARAAHPGTDTEALLDCADAPGHAMAALAAGVTELSFNGSRETAQKLTEMGAAIRPRPAEALDLAEEPEPEAACRAWLLDGR
jgi:hypothetical protein